MRVVNHTRWRTNHLRAFLTRVAQAELTPAQRQLLRVEIKYNRQKDRGSCSGHAQCPGNRMCVMVPSVTVDKVDLAMVIAHEMAHTHGLSHPSMRGNPAYRRLPPRTQAIYSWASDLPLEPKPKAMPRTPAQKNEEKLTKVIRMVQKWERRAKLTKTILTKWRRKQRYYEQRTAAIAASSPNLSQELSKTSVPPDVNECGG